MTVESLVFIGNRSVTVWSFVLGNWYTSTFPLTGERHRCNWSRPRRLHRGPRPDHPQPPVLTLHSPGPVRRLRFQRLASSSQLGRFNSFKGTQLPPFFQCCSHACEFLFKHAWQPHQKHFDFVCRYLLERKKSHFWRQDSSERRQGVG